MSSLYVKQTKTLPVLYRKFDKGCVAILRIFSKVDEFAKVQYFDFGKLGDNWIWAFRVAK